MYSSIVIKKKEKFTWDNFYLVTLVLLILILVVNSLFGQQFKIKRSDGQADEYFGNSVSIHGDYAIVGAYFDDDNGWGSGSAYIFKKEGDNWDQKQKLLPSGIDDYDFFGTSVSIYNDVAVIGATGDNGTGTVYIFRRSGETWNQETILIPSNGSSGDLFGTSVAVNNATVVVGATGDDISTGSVYIFQKEGSSWVEKQNIYATDGINFDYFGCSVALDDGVLAVGVKGYLGTGGVYVYIQDGDTWENVNKIRADDNGLEDKFGASVSVSQNFIAAGARFEDEGGLDCGAAYIFVREGNSWTQNKKIIPHDGIANERFGKVAIDGNVLAIGADHDDDLGLESGSVYIYEWNGNDWIFNQKIVADDGFAGDGFGSSVSINNNRVIVGSPYDNEGASDAGSSYVIDLQGITNVQKNKTIPTEYSLSQNYPNPFGEAIPTGNPSTTIKYTLPRYGGQDFIERKSSFAQITTGLNKDKSSESLYNVTLKIYDILGREVATLVNKQQFPGTYEVIFSPSSSNSHLASGVYFYRIKVYSPGQAGKYIETKKMILLK